MLSKPFLFVMVRLSFSLSAVASLIDFSSFSELHPLALEDIFHTRSQNRSKADYFSRHLFIRVLCHELGEVQNIPAHQTAAFGSTLTDAPRSSSPEPMDTVPEDKEEARTSFSSSSGSSKNRKKGPLLPHSRRDVFAVKDENRTLMGTLLGVSDV